MVIWNKLLFMVVFSLVSIGKASAQEKKDSVWIQTNDGCKVYNPSPAKNESITWTGACVNGYATGEGTLIWYKNGKRGQEYVGALKRGITHGYGKYTYEGGSSYEGHYVNGQEEGKGRYRRLENNVLTYTYVGDYSNGDPEGVGVEVLYEYGDTASCYTGSFVKGVKHGRGTGMARDGSFDVVYAGVFVDDRLEDDRSDIKEYAEGNLIRHYTGGFHDHARTGFGIEIAGLNKYEGQWSRNMKNGTGKLFYNGVVIYDGEWLDDKLDGIGTRIFLDGSQYRGQFKKNERHGYGIVRWKDGAQYIGEFKKDLFAGQGYTVYRDDRLNTSGIWEKGSLTVPLNIVTVRKELDSRYKEVIQRLKN
ncbi:MORN repeat-containing protein [Parachryseolinea silvisoli]|uniref:hypothetical protein n=1 Tax=Parachryseolinea silvisoli TaxID=2873601 RepID=UPI002265CAE0|nr:hypothetical protein [Parachryseolinea silvisoli]MCD9015504.1 hypothetical protein [Parachryseolinea silvisoli]